MSDWKKLPALPGRPNPCMNCPPIPATLPPDRWIAVGFGGAGVSKDGVGVWDYSEHDENDPWTVAEAEAAAAADPDHDWRIYYYGPLHEEEYQRHGPKKWVLIRKGEGLA
jgi:hypothetical protein